jgi:gamma-glutamylcyclotransferase (GGCT)/AIG2-like uncharacterized protein YtfP
MERPDEASTLFVYGSLLDAAHRAEIIGRRVETAPATVRDYERVRRRYYFIRKRPGGLTPGLLLLKLTRRDFDALDRYEEVPSLYTREKIEVASDDGANVRCWAYLPTALTIAADCGHNH